MSYIMESEQEAARLLAQEENDRARERLLVAGLTSGQKALDAGCGPGGVAAAMADLVGPEGEVLGIDQNAERLEVAKKTFGGTRPQLSFRPGDILKTGLPDAHYDFTWSQFVFQYLRAPETALAELIRVTRPGGKVVVSEVDGAGTWHWPTTPALEKGIATLQAALARTGFDPFVGRKMLHAFRQAGLRDVQVQMSPFYLYAGAAHPTFLADWRTRFDTLAPLVAPLFGGAEGFRAFADEYLAMLKNPDTLKYAVVLVTYGTRG